MNGDGRPSPPLVISRPEYINLVARYYVETTRQVTRIKNDALAAAEMAGFSGATSGYIPLSVEQRHNVRTVMAAFWKVLEYAPQYNVSQADISRITAQIDERLNAEAGEHLPQGCKGIQEATSLVARNEAVLQRQIMTPVVERLESGNPSSGEAWVERQAQMFQPISQQAVSPHPPIRQPYAEAAFGARNDTSSSQISPVMTSTSRNSPARTVSPQLFGPKQSTSTFSATTSPDVGIVNPRPLEYNGCVSPDDFSALAGAAVLTAQQIEDNRRRRSSDAQSRRSSGAYPRRESGLTDVLIPVPQGLAPSAYENRPPWAPAQPHSAFSATTPNIQATGYQIPSVSPFLSSAVSFASATPPLGAVVSPTLPTSGRFESPASSSVFASSERVPMPRTDAVEVVPAAVPVTKEVQAIEIPNPRTARDSSHASFAAITIRSPPPVISPATAQESPTSSQMSSPPVQLIPPRTLVALEQAPVFPLFSFEFKPPAKPIPSLPDWLSGGCVTEKRKEERPPLPDWARSSAVQIAERSASVATSSKRRRSGTDLPFSYNKNREASKTAGEVIDLTGDSSPIRSTPPFKASSAEERIGHAQQDNVVEQMDITLENAPSARGELSADSGRPGNPPALVIPDKNGSLSAHSDSEPVSSDALIPAISRLIDEAEAVTDRMFKQTGIRSKTAASTELWKVNADVEMQDLAEKSHSETQSKAPALSWMLNDIVMPGYGPPISQPSPIESATSTLPLSIAPSASRRTDDLDESREDSRSEARATPDVAESPFRIPEELAFEDVIQWQRKVWRACFCDWSQCGAVLHNWEGLEKHVGLVHVKHQRPRPKPKPKSTATLQPPSLHTFRNSSLGDSHQAAIRRIPGEYDGRRSSSENDDTDPIALLSTKASVRANPTKLMSAAPNPQISHSELREMNSLQPKEAWLPYICRFGDCGKTGVAEVAFVTIAALHVHVYSHHLDVNGNKGFISCVVNDCPYTFSESFSTLAKSHRHIRQHLPFELAQMRFNADMQGKAPSTNPPPLPEGAVPTYLVSCPPIRRGFKAPIEDFICTLAKTQASWDAEPDMSFRTAFGFVPFTHSDPEMKGCPIPAYDMYAQNTPSSTRTTFNPVPEYSLCTPRHPASHRSWKRLPVAMSLGPKRTREKIVTPWCNLSAMEREENEKLKIVMSRDLDEAVKEQAKLPPRRIALEDRSKIPEGSDREWPLRGTIGPGYYLDDN
ncbi:hypothetical protein NliqN6_1193 [Naganishia liquefaciens]|uniref:C2H2-type domain-containing protein n=1 Tax=Naganishia liquefaciens TaxID=104408 RepID=A0A8H3YEI4_9TREE|nr:hypothetical protein NliqN6_1193 [Naganishia liquefaciens]